MGGRDEPAPDLDMQDRGVGRPRMSRERSAILAPLCCCSANLRGKLGWNSWIQEAPPLAPNPGIPMSERACALPTWLTLPTSCVFRDIRMGTSLLAIPK